MTRQEFTLRCLVTITWAFAAFRRGWVNDGSPSIATWVMLIFSSLAGTKKSTCFRPLVTTWSPRRRQWVILSLATWVSEYLHIFVLSRSAMWWILMLAMPIRWVKSSSRISYFLQQPGPYCELWWTGEHCLVAASVVMVYTCALHGVFFGPNHHATDSGLEIQVDELFLLPRNILIKSA